MTAGQLMKNGTRQPVVRPRNGQNLNTTSLSAVLSAAFTAGTELVRISCTEDVYYRIGDATVVAVVGDALLPAGTTEMVRLNNGADTHISALQLTGLSGIVNLTECD